jgi:hypothetical protein
MILDYINGNLFMLQLKFIIASFLWLVVLVAIGIDLFFGIKKSKSTGEFTHSLMFDAISPLGLIHDKFNILPLASIVGCIILVWTEFISVREKSEEKFRRKTDKVAKDLLELAMKDENLLKRIKETFKDE